jgi:hypothetical protein
LTTDKLEAIEKIASKRIWLFRFSLG